MRYPLSPLLKIAAGAIPFFLFACGRSTSASIQDASTVTGAGGNIIEKDGTSDNTSQPATDGAPASGGTGAGGTGGSGGAVSSGGETGTGGQPGTGGATGGGRGGASGTSGKTGTGGTTFTGGTILSSAGTSGTGGAIGTGTFVGSGGSSGTGGTTGPGGSLAPDGGTGGGGAPGTGGSSGTGGAGGTGGVTGTATLPPKFFGNIDTRSAVRSDFATYWDQFTPEDAGKWAAVQSSSATTFNWNSLDAMYKYCEDNHILFKEHCFIWGSAQPAWINNSNVAAVAQNWMKSFCDRYPKTRLIDVVNEPLHTTPGYKDGLGGAGTSGWDWIVNSFKWAHEACPNAVLILNEYNLIEYSGEHARIIELVKAIRAAGAPIMAIGAQGHDAAKVAVSTLQTYLADIANQTGLPVYITELDLGVADDVEQATIMKDIVTTFWNDPNMAGITYWGYIVGTTWRSNTGLMTSTGTMRPAMIWLMDFLHR